MDAVVGDGVSFCEALVVAPAPADGDSGVVEVADVVVGDAVVGAVAYPDAHGAGEEASGGADYVVVDVDVAGAMVLIGGDGDFADANASGSEVVEVGMPEAAVAASLAEPDGVSAGVGDFAIDDADVSGAVDEYDGVDGRGGLAGLEAGGRGEPLAVVEGEAFDTEMLDELLGCGIALHEDESVAAGGDGLGGFFAGSGDVGEVSVTGEEPFAGGVEGLGKIFELESCVFFPGVPGLHRLAAGDHGVVGGIDGVDEASGVVPFVIDQEVDVVELFLGEPFERVELFGSEGQDLADGGIGAFWSCFFEFFFAYVLHVVVELVWRTGSGGALAVDEQLLEVPLAGGDLGDVRVVSAVGALGEVGDDSSGGEEGSGVGGGGWLGAVGNGAGVGAAVLGGEDERLGEFVAAWGDQDCDGLGEALVGFELADTVACGGEAAQGPVGLCVVGGLERARECVISVGRDVEELFSEKGQRP